MIDKELLDGDGNGLDEGRYLPILRSELVDSFSNNAIISAENLEYVIHSAELLFLELGEEEQYFILKVAEILLDFKLLVVEVIVQDFFVIAVRGQELGDLDGNMKAGLCISFSVLSEARGSAAGGLDARVGMKWFEGGLEALGVAQYGILEVVRDDLRVIHPGEAREFED